MVLLLRKRLPTSNVTRLIRTIHKMSGLLKPPESVRGLTELNKNKFQKSLSVPCLSISDIKPSSILPLVKPYLLKFENLKPIQHEEDMSVSICLNPQVIKSWKDFPTETQSALENLTVQESDLKNKDILLKYENFSAEDILRAVLPTDKEGLSSFTKIGHIVHVNIREHLLPYKTLIGEVLFDKVRGCRSVVNKINSIDNTYRNFKMEVLKGDSDMLTTVRENNCTFKFDFSTVYWNSRLCTEHERIVNKLNAGDVLFDVFAGVGPFSLPAAKKKCYVYANDLNPESFKWLEHNAKANKIQGEYFKAYNKDGKDFIRTVFKENLPIHLKNKQNIYVTMNLPALAVEFLSGFVGLFEADDLEDFEKPPTVVVYCFAKGSEYTSIARDLVIQHFGCDVSDKILDIFRVRTVSSMKEMMRVTLRLDRDVLLGNVGGKRKLEDGSESKTKKNCVEGEFL